MKKTITKDARLALIGLLHVGESLNQKLKLVEETMREITGEEADEIGSSHCSDTLYGVEMTQNKEVDADRLLKLLEITVTD